MSSAVTVKSGSKPGKGLYNVRYLNSSLMYFTSDEGKTESNGQQNKYGFIQGLQ